MYKMAVNTCETIRSNRRIQQLITLNRDELNVKSHESSLTGLLEAEFALTNLANSHADHHLAKSSLFETSFGDGLGIERFLVAQLSSCKNSRSALSVVTASLKLKAAACTK